MPPDTAQFDLVLVGATGFTGTLVAEYLARTAPPELRWALAGRSPDRLATVRAGLGETWTDLPLLEFDAGDPASADALAARTQVVATTVGPYIRYGEPLVAACARHGRGYLDLTGEPEFVDLMYARHHAQAVESGARIVHACGFDSIPYDLGVLYTVDQLSGDRPITVRGVVRASGAVSGGTLATVLEAVGRPTAMPAAAKARRAVEDRTSDRQVHTPLGIPTRSDGLWLLPLPTLDPQIVGRSARALPQYGPDFTYRHYAGFRHLPVLAGAVAGFGAAAVLTQLPPVRSWLTRRVPSGSGPSQARRESGWFTARFTVEGASLVTEVSGGEPGYAATSIMFGESALCLALDDLPAVSGQLTTAVAMGRTLIARLQKAGIEFRTL